VSPGGNPFGDELAEAAARAEIAGVDSDGAESDEDEAVPAGPAGPVQLDVDLDGEQYSYDDWDPRTTLLEHLESKGVKAPFSCREGECSACAIRLVEGEVRMDRNDVLDDEDLADGIRLGCQSHPMTEKVSVSYS
jgi:3-ketosteroid 9alpha-monooxygenase subunit B